MIQFTARDVKTVGEDRYWRKKSNTMFILFISAALWLAAWIVFGFLSGSVGHMKDVYIYQGPTSGNVTLTMQELTTANPFAIDRQLVVGNEIVTKDEEQSTRDASLPFSIASMLPLFVVVIYMAVLSWKATKAGEDLVAEWAGGKIDNNEGEVW